VRHLDRVLEIPCPIVEAREQMTVEIDCDRKRHVDGENADGSRL
jgi:hypothetical protein